MEKIDEMVLSLPKQFLDIAKRGILEEGLDTEEKKVYLNIVINHKEEFRRLFIDNYLYTRVINALILFFGGMDFLMYMANFNKFMLCIIILFEINLIKKGSTDIVETKSYMDLDIYIESLEKQIAEEIADKEKGRILKRNEQYEY